MTPLETVVAALEAAGANPRPSARGFAALCPAHGDRNPSLSVAAGEGGRVVVRCYAGCDTRAVLEAIGLTWGHLFPDGAPYRVPGQAAPTVPPVKRTIREPEPPTPDFDLVDRIMVHALENVQGDAAAPWRNKRGVSVKVCLKYCVGFMPWMRFKGWRGAIPNVWVIPVTHYGKVVALKLHRENPPEGFAKGSWAPIGMTPADKPRHGFATLWPAPESFDPREKLYLLPGELKALAVLDTGRAATSVTAGEGMRWTPGLLKRFEGRQVCIVYDDDNAGRKFLGTTSAALSGWAAKVTRATFGRKDKG